MTRVRWRVSRGAVASRRWLATGILILSFTMSVAVSSVGIGSAIYLDVVREGMRASYGGFNYQSMSSGPRSIALMERMTQHGEAVGMIQHYGTVRSGSLSAVATVAETTKTTRFGTLLAGSYPARPGELAVSTGAAEQLQVRPGSTVAIPLLAEHSGPGLWRVTGITLNPAKPDEPLVAAISRDPKLADRALQWFSDIDPSRIEQIDADLSGGVFRMGSLAESMEYAVLEAQHTTLSGVGQLTVLLVGAAGLGLLILLLATYRSLNATASGLVAAGVRRCSAWWWTIGGFVLLAGLGTAAGLGGTAVAISVGGEQLGAALGQRWDFGVEHLGDVGYLLVGYYLLAVLSSFALAMRTGSRARRWHAHPRRRAGGLALGCLVGVSVAAAYTILSGDGVGYLAAMGFAAAGGALALWLIPWYPPRSVIARATDSVAMLPVLSLVVFVVLLAATTMTSTQMMMRADVLRRASPVGADFLTVGFLNQGNVDYLAARYPQVMRNAIVFTMADQADSQPRVTTVNELGCYEHRGSVGDQPECQGWISVVGFAPDSGPGAELGDHAAPAVLAGGDGQVGLVYFDPATTKVQRVARTRVLRGASPLLSAEHLPGLVFAADSQMARQLGIRPSVERRIFILDFASKSRAEQNSFRSAVLSLSSYARIHEGFTSNVTSYETLGWVIALVGSAVGCAWVLLVRMGARSGQARLRAVMGQSGATRWQFARLEASVLANYLLAAIAAPLVGRLITRTELVDVGGLPGAASGGHYWLLPVPILSTFVVGIWLAGLREHGGV